MLGSREDTKVFLVFCLVLFLGVTGYLFYGVLTSPFNHNIVVTIIMFCPLFGAIAGIAWVLWGVIKKDREERRK